MASQEWITDSNLGTRPEESAINFSIEYVPSTEENRRTLEPILLSSNLPSEIKLLVDTSNNTIMVSGTLPKVDEDTEYFFTYRLKEVEVSNPTNVTNILDRYFTFTSKNIPVSWNNLENLLYTGNNCIFEMNLKDYLDHPNGNETFKKVNGTLPEGVLFDDNGTVVGYVEEEIEDVTDFKFEVRVYSNGLPIEGLEDKEFIIQVDPETMEQKPTWTTDSNLGNINKNETIGPTETKTIKLNAMDLSGSDGTLRFILAPDTDENVVNDPTITGLPPGMSLRNDGNIVGTCTTTQVKDWYFGAYAVKYVEEDDNTIYSDYKKFLLSTNRGSAEHEISWIDPTKTYALGTFVIGEEISLQLPLATAADGSIIKYSFSGNTYPKGIELSDSGLINGTLDLQDTGNYDFEVMAKTDYTYITRKFRMGLKQGLSESALKLYLRINLEYKDEYTDIKDQLNPNTLYNNDVDNYNVSNFPKIDIATLKCYDREVLASMMNFGNPEIVRFGLTKSLPYSHIDGNGNLTANYEVFYKSIDENTYQWEPIEMGDYDFQAKLDQLQTTGEIDNDAKIEFNNDDYHTSVKAWKLLGEVPTYSKLLSCNTTELKFGYFAKVLKDETHNDEIAYYMYNGDPTPSLAWVYSGNELPQEIDPVVKTNPDDSYQVFNFKNVREILSQRIYVYQKEGTFYYDEGSQQIVTPTGNIESIKVLHHAVEDMYHEGEQIPYIKKGEYYITDEDGENETLVDYESHIVTEKETGRVYVNILFKPDFNSPNFMVYEDGGEIYYVNEITNPWCFDFNANTNIGIDTVPPGEEMVMPNIKTSDVNMMLGGSPYVVFLDTAIEPLPMWKRKQAEMWKPNTTYKAKEIIIYDSIYYKVKQQFTTGNEFVFDDNLLEVVSGDVIDAELPKNYFPTLDLGYYQSGTNRRYLKDLNIAEKKGDYWYRKDFLFWEIIAEPVYNQDIDTFGIPFYSTQNRMEFVNQDRKTRRTFEIDCDTPDVVVSITVTQPDGSIIPTPTPVGNKWKVTFDIGSRIVWNVSAGDNYYPEGGDYVVVSDEKHVITLKKKCTVTIIPDPSDATVTITAPGYTQEGNSITVREGTHVEYTVEKEDYLSAEGSIDAKNFNHEINVRLKPYRQLLLKVTYTNTTDDDSLPLITLAADGAKDISETTKNDEESHDNYWVVEKSIKVPEGNYVSYIVSKTGLNTKRGNYKVNLDTTLPLTLNGNSYTFTVNPTPGDATVVIDAQIPLGPQIGNSRVVSGKPNDGSSATSTITYIVSKEGYETFSETLPYISSDTTVDVTIKKFYNFSIVIAQPADADVKIFNITGAKTWEPQKYYNEHSLVIYDDKYYNCVQDHTSLMEFDPSKWSEVTTSVWVVDGTNIQYEIKRVGYREIKTNITIKKDEEVVIRMESTGGFCPEWTDTDLFCLETNEAVSFQSEASSDSNLQRYTFRINTSPADAGSIIQVNGETYYSKEVSDIQEGSQAYYKIFKDHYVTQEDNLFVVNDVTKNIDLELEQHALTINPDPVDSTVVILATGYNQSGNTLVAHYGTEAEYEVARKYYVTRTGSYTILEDRNIEVPLTREKYTVTVNVDPAENTTVTLSAQGYPIVTGNNGTASITVDSETEISYSLRHSGYVDKTGTLTALETSTVEMVMTPTYTFTINPTPADSTVTLTAAGYTQVGNSIIVPTGTTVAWSVSRTNMASQSGSKEITSDTTDNITLAYASGYTLFESRTPNTYTLQLLTSGNYYLEIVGAGGGGYTSTLPWGSYPVTSSGSGGSGAFVYGTKYLSAGTYTLTIGAGGSNGGGAGAASTAFGETAGGAGGGRGGSGGAGGTPSTTLTGKNGYTGNARGASISWSNPSPRKESAYDDTTSGPGYGGATGEAGGAGFIKVTAV